VLAAVAAVVWHRGTRFRRTRNMVLLVVGQLLMTVFLLDVVNAHEHFYTTWGDLLGLSGPGAVSVVSSGPGLGVPTPAPVAGLLGRGHAGALDRTLTALRQTHRGHGSLVTDIPLVGPRTGYRWKARVYLPAAYFSPAYAHRTFPVLEAFPGSGSGPGASFGSVPLQQSLDRAIAIGTVPPLIAVSPSRNPSRLRDQQCLDDPHGWRMFTYLARDVPTAMEHLFRARHDRGGWVTMGFSSGGYCAANLAVRRPDQYSATVSMSGYFSGPINRFPMVDPTPQERRVNSPLDAVRAVHRPLSFVFVSARDDLDAMRELTAFAAVVRSIRGDHATTITTATGGHSAIAWRGTLPAVLVTLGADLYRTGLPTRARPAARCAVPPPPAPSA
jgi:enterochelin esterase-like enzyme